MSTGLIGDKMTNKHVKLLCISGILTALVFVITAYPHIPTNNGYIHVGDALIFLAGCILPWQYAIFVGSVGALLADCLTGFALWAPASIIIKTVTALLFTNKGDKIMSLRNYLVLFPATIICAGGYYLYESLIYSNFISPLASIPASIVQSVVSSALFICVGLAFDKIKFKSKFNGVL